MQIANYEQANGSEYSYLEKWVGGRINKLHKPISQITRLLNFNVRIIVLQPVFNWKLCKKKTFQITD